jgi:hypothetical protein
MTDIYRVLVTSSRSWTAKTRTADGLTLDDVLDAVAADAARGGYVGLRVVHGACYPRADEAGRRPDESGDWLAELWVRDRQWRGWPVMAERHPAAWKKYLKTAGFRRNADMVALGANRCVALIDACQKHPCEEPQPCGTHGATHCADLAEQAGIPTERCYPAGVEHRLLDHTTESED